MLDRLIAAIIDLPVIVQGAMGSALFALLLLIGQKISASLGAWHSQSSKSRKEQALIDEMAVLSGIAATDIRTSTHYTLIVLYRASRHVVRALYWLTLGLLFGSTISVFGIVGYLGCLFYLLQALRLVQGKSKEEIDGVQTRLAQVKEELRIIDAAPKE